MPYSIEDYIDTERWGLSSNLVPPILIGLSMDFSVNAVRVMVKVGPVNSKINGRSSGS